MTRELFQSLAIQSSTTGTSFSLPAGNHHKQCRVSQASAPLKSCNCYLFQNNLTKEKNWEENNCINITNLRENGAINSEKKPKSLKQSM